MAIYASPDEMVVRRPPGRRNRWTFIVLLTTFLGLVYFLQCKEQAADHLVALQHVVVKNKSIRGFVNRTGFITSGFEQDISEDGLSIEDDDNVMEMEEPESEVKEEAIVEEAQKEDSERPDTAQDTSETPEKTEEKNDDETKTEDEGEAKTIKEEESKEQEAENIKKEDVETPAKDDAPETSNECSSKCSERLQQQKDRWNGDLLDMKDVGLLVKKAYDKLVDKLKVDYGEEYFAKIFLDNDGKSRGRTAFLSSGLEESQSSDAAEGVSLKRLKRKLKMKVLEAQLSVQRELESFGDCDCKSGTKMSTRTRHLEGNQQDLADHHGQFIWATGGHSSAAGHGNLFNESYTAVLERDMADIFGSIGISMEARNFAMGGTNSAPELALCSEAIFGTDVDVISYDYCMTDGRNWDKKGMFASRGAGLNPGRPVIIDMFIDKFVERRVLELKKLEERGLAGLYMNSEMFRTDMKDGIPDTFGLTTEQINALPPFVRHFKCQDVLEKGDPTCEEMKFDKDLVCPDRHFMSSWHPGWRLQALYGNAMALFLAETLMDAISEMSSVSDRASLLRHLQYEENKDYQTFRLSDVPPLENDFLKQIGDELLNETSVDLFYRSPSICHTGRLPAQTRYLGILNESDETGVHDYFKGMTKEEAEKIETQETMAMPLVYDPNDRQTCEVELNRDYKDYFYTSDKMDWTTMTIPNKAELDAYGRKDADYKGMLVMCLKYCDWGKCPKGDMQLEQIQKGQVKFEVNGLEVKNVTKFSDCGVLRGEQGHFWKPNNDGQYVLKAKVIGDGSDLSYLRISSLVLL